MERLDVDLPQIKIAENICYALLNKYPIDYIIDLIKENKDCRIYITSSRDKPNEVDILVDKVGRYKYQCNEFLCIPIPKKFAVLEPDKRYFEATLKANIFLAVLKADEKELHQ
ncbi:hypothetical protein DRO97_08885 [Archaeoglobales archaeon]|nr:MAG: hypothetical protein DRO97_08885 [Archaeoglobales archaeon]